ncbi:MAG: TraI domain-containing protein, partial [Hydrogenophilales bacterium]|nr:TraI domain-containing protein [Hydrogenophilales bacterium]
IDARAEAYVVDFPQAMERNYQAHQHIGIQLMQRHVPTEARLWLSSDRVLMDELLGYLSGAAQGPIAEIVREAESESVRRNLAAGSRLRFATSKATPLIELLMHALRTLLAEGGHLPLNRPGAAGFCDGTDIWFAAVRLTNDIRAWLSKAFPEAAIPCEALNDRLFDTWQEYGACRTNPATHGAIWSASIEFAGGQRIQLGALLRFPLGPALP